MSCLIFQGGSDFIFLKTIYYLTFHSYLGEKGKLGACVHFSIFFPILSSDIFPISILSFV